MFSRAAAFGLGSGADVRFLQETTWGRAVSGGDSRGVAAQLSSGVQTVVGTRSAFAAVKVDGSVVTWGHAGMGGDSSGVAEQLSSRVQTVVGNSSP